MELVERLRAIRESYVEYYRRALASMRDKGVECAAEVWVKPNIKPGEPAPPELLCIDIMQTSGEGALTMVTAGPPPASPSQTMWIRDVPVTLYSPAWENMFFWLRRSDPDWSAFDPWKR
jgi:hypothetical protein